MKRVPMSSNVNGFTENPFSRRRSRILGVWFIQTPFRSCWIEVCTIYSQTTVKHRTICLAKHQTELKLKTLEGSENKTPKGHGTPFLVWLTQFLCSYYGRGDQLSSVQTISLSRCCCAVSSHCRQSSRDPIGPMRNPFEFRTDDSEWPLDADTPYNTL